MATGCFTYCRCPHCKHPLDEVSTKVTACPLCNRPLESRAVWLTCRRPGEIVLPGWLKAFGWPFLVLLAGVGLGGIGWAGLCPIPLKLPAALIAIGLEFFFYKLFTNGEEL